MDKNPKKKIRELVKRMTSRGIQRRMVDSGLWDTLIVL